MARNEVIRAAGVVLLRDNEQSRETLIVHRPMRKDWSLPKGKVDAGEHIINAAVRECDEESGFIPLLGAPLPTQQYSVEGRPKVVNYWLARVGSEEGFAPDDEIDEVRWVDVTQAADYLTYPSDLKLIDHALQLPPTVPLVILRHTQAMKRADFKGNEDHERPLSGRGRSQSKQLVPLLDAFGVTTVHASSARRCLETVKRFAKSQDTTIVAEPALTEEGHRHDAERAYARAAEIALLPEPLVLCSHRPVLPTILDAVADELSLDTDVADWDRLWDPKLPPGGFLVIHRAFTPDGFVGVVGLERHTLST